MFILPFSLSVDFTLTVWTLRYYTFLFHWHNIWSSYNHNDNDHRSHLSLIFPRFYAVRVHNKKLQHSPGQREGGWDGRLIFHLAFLGHGSDIEEHRVEFYGDENTDWFVRGIRFYIVYNYMVNENQGESI